ncbi:MAG TPA: hypothetical protein VHC86_04240 [Opitutaceae bacterium]|nr:hypothetical protein [Opitutaceae bacterium]
MNRRDFIVKTSLATAAATLLSRRLGAQDASKGVSLVMEAADPDMGALPVQWAADRLRETLGLAGFAVRNCARLSEAPEEDVCIVVAGTGSRLSREAGVVAPEDGDALSIGTGLIGSRNVLVASGGGVRGVVYALLELAEAVADNPAAALQPADTVSEKPANVVRSVMRCFTSDVEDKAWYHDKDFWDRYLTLLVSQRFNRFNLSFGLGYDAPNGLRDTYLYFAYPFLLSVPGYDVKAVGLADAERDKNLEMLRYVSDQAALRGLEFQLGLWTHAYQWTNSPHANYTISGLTPRTQAAYSRDALAILLKECPGITGVTFRIHGESGVPEGSYDLWKTIFSAVGTAGRPLRLDMHAKGMTPQMIEVAAGTNQPFSISPKFWAEHLGLPYHQADIRPTEIPKQAKGRGPYADSEGARSFLRYGYGDLFQVGRKYNVLFRIWPGTQKLLLSGDAAFGAGYGRAMSFCGAEGCELFEPLSFKGREGSGLPGGRGAYADAGLRAAGGDHEKYLVTYRYWGRLLYNPKTSPEGWRRQFRRDYGPAAEPAEVLLRHASRILPLITTAHLPSASNNSYWPEIYTNMAIAAEEPPRPYPDTPAPRGFNTVSPLDPQLFSTIARHAEALLDGDVDGKYSPVEVAQWLEDLSHSTLVHLEETTKAAKDPAAPAFRRLAVDTRIQAGIGRFFGQKLRAGVLFALFRQTGDPRAKAEALRLYRSAREAWAGLAEAARGVYREDITFGDAPHKRGSWADRLPAIDADLAAMEAASAPPNMSVHPDTLARLIQAAAAKPQRPSAKASGEQPAVFRRNQPVALAFACDPAPSRVTLHYRRVTHAERWKSAAMTPEGAGWKGEIPADYTDSPYALQYYFEPVDGSGAAWLHPGLGQALTTQPYFVLLQKV